jgi:GT2 family glycosyltransferase
MLGVSVVIPNYNGQSLLEKHLPSVLKALRDDDEVVLIDDASTDTSWQWLTDHFKSSQVKKSDFSGKHEEGVWRQGTRHGRVILLQNADNKRFAASCNLAVEVAGQPLIYLLNTDVSPSAQSITKLVRHFEDSSVFAVGCREHEHADKKDEPVVGGRNELRFERGMFVHQRARHFESGPTAWASGGSSMFDRQKWVELGGFDLDYYPAYWEDVDLSFRAKQKGWKVLFDNDAVVDHMHESTNSSAFGQKKMQRMSWQHAHTFVLKHATFWQKIQYLLWQPYWWWKMTVFAPQQVQLLFFLLIVLIAFLTRGLWLGQIPHGLAWDEAAIGYNGFSVATTGRDEWLHKLPISFKSFGDFKAPLAIYGVGVFVRLFGLNPFVIRLPFMLAGVVSVVAWMAFIKLVWSTWFPKKIGQQFPILDSTSAALLSGVFFAISPWHIHFSRVAFESGLALSLVLCGLVGITWLLEKKEKWPAHLLTAVAIGSAMLFSFSLYAYHSTKVFVPLLLALFALTFWPKLRRNLLHVGLWLGLFVAFLIPLGIDSFRGQGGERFQQASVLGRDLPLVEKVTTVTQNFAAHFSPRFLIGGETPTLRHGDGHWGIIYSTELFLILVAITTFAIEASKKFSGKVATVLPIRALFFAIGWIVVGTFPAAIGVDVPHSNRMLLALPGFLLLAVLGWQAISRYWEGKLFAPAMLGTLLLLQSFFTVSYLNHYYTNFAPASDEAFSDGYLEVMEIVKKYEPSVEKILFTSKYQQPYIYALLSRKTSPYEYHSGSLIKYEFSDKVTMGEIARPNALIVGTPEELDPRFATEVVRGSGGEIRFVIIKTP